jgi:hypothetical protein
MEEEIGKLCDELYIHPENRKNYTPEDVIGFTIEELQRLKNIEKRFLEHGEQSFYRSICLKIDVARMMMDDKKMVECIKEIEYHFRDENYN